MSEIAIGQEGQGTIYEEPGIYKNRNLPIQHPGEAIDPFTGRLQLHYVDAVVPGNGGLDIKIQRSYNGLQFEQGSPPPPGVLGIGWSFHFGILQMAAGTSCAPSSWGAAVGKNPTLTLPDGSNHIIYAATGLAASAVTKSWWRAKCGPGGVGMIVTSPDGVSYDMTEPGGTNSFLTKKITDRNGNFLAFTYVTQPLDGAIVPSRIDTSDQRVVTFSYETSGIGGKSRLRQFVAQGRTFSFIYQNLGGIYGNGFFQLTQVQGPEGLRWSYTYNAQLASSFGSYSIKTITYPYGGTTSYDYEGVSFPNATGAAVISVVRRKTTSDGGIWTYEYHPGGGEGSLDRTIMSGPEGKTTWQHFGYSKILNGEVWKLGLLADRSLQSDLVVQQTERLTWDKRQISNQTDRRAPPYAGKADSATSVPVLTSRTIVRDGSPYTTSYGSFDAYGNPALISESGNASRSASRTYHVDTTRWIVKQLKDHVEPGGSSVQRTIFINGNLASESRNGVRTDFQYDGSGNLATVTNARNFVKTFSSYFRGIPRIENHPEGVTVGRNVDDNGNVTSQTDADGITTSYGYDDLNRVVSVVPPLGALQSSIAWSFVGGTKAVTRGSLVETTVFDGFGRPKSVSRSGISWKFDYDAVGRKTFASYAGALARGTSFQYDILGRTKRIEHGDGSSVNVSFLSGNRRREINENQDVTTTTYRSFGDPDHIELMEVDAPLPAASVTIARDLQGNVREIQQNGVRRTFDYDSRGFLMSSMEPEVGAVVFGRDAVGNMTSRRVGSSTTTFGIDGLDRVESIAFPGSSTPTVTKTYTKTSRLKTVVSSASDGRPQISRTLEYDSRGNRTRETVTVGTSPSRAVKMDYDGYDHLASITHEPSGLLVQYSPDLLGRPTRAAPFVTSVTHFDSGNVRRMTMANGVSTDFVEQADRPWLDHITVARGSTFANLAYSYDARGNPRSIIDSANAANNRSLTFDALDRLATASGPWGGGTIAYNGTGDIESQSYGGDTTLYTYGANRRLASVSRNGEQRILTYDARGNVTHNGQHAFRYNESDKLDCVDCASTGRTEYAYDGEGLMSHSRKDGVETHYLYSLDGMLMGEYIPSRGNYRREHVYLQGKRVFTRTVVTEAASGTALSVNPTSISFGGSVSMTAAVTGSTPTGTVAFKDGAAVIAGCNNVPLVGTSASCSTTQLPVGTRSITAAYSGDTFNQASTSAAVSVTILPVPDPVPDAFGFASKTAVARSATITSDPLIPAGYNTSASVSVTGGSYSIGCTATYVTSAGSISPGQSICVRHVSSPNYAAPTTTSLTIGGVTGTFTSVTVQSFGITVALAGNGGGSVSSTPAGISCGATCSANFDEGTPVTLTATPAAGSVFTGWAGGPCTGTGPCTFTMATTFAVTATFTNPSLSPRLLNLATRGPVLTGDSIMIGGFIIGGTQPKTVLVKGVGPSLLNYGVPDALLNPVMQLYAGANVIAANDDWGTAGNAATMQALGVAPAHPQEPAILMTLNPGAYTVLLYGAAGGTGNGMISVSEIDRPESPLINISTRGQVLTGGNVMIAGLVIGGSAPQTVVIRARGPSLAAAGIPNTLPNPLLQLFSGATQIAVNDDWGTAANAATLQVLGYAPSHPNESALLVTLNPGGYTAIVSGVGGTTGMGLVEVFAVLP